MSERPIMQSCFRWILPDIRSAAGKIDSKTHNRQRTGES